MTWELKFLPANTISWLILSLKRIIFVIVGRSDIDNPILVEFNAFYLRSNFELFITAKLLL